MEAEMKSKKRKIRKIKSDFEWFVFSVGTAISGGDIDAGLMFLNCFRNLKCKLIRRKRKVKSS